MKYAVIEAGGKQYIAREGEAIEVDRIPLGVGEKVDFKDVMLVVDGKDVQVGAPFVTGANVKGTISEQFKAPKIIVFKYIPKERYRRKRGHRQHYTRVEVERISVRKTAKKAEAVEEHTGEGPKAEAKKPAKRKKQATKAAAPKKGTGSGKSKASKTAAKKKSGGTKAKSETKSRKTSAGSKSQKSKGKKS
jgi:large subunit ribosomal protein L21